MKAQTKVHLINADSIVGGTFQKEQIQKLLGNVHMKTTKFDMYADSAYKFPGLNKVIAYGNIEIDTKKYSIWADTITYFTNTNFSKLRGRVIIESDSTTLFGKSANYHFKTQIAHFLDGVRLEDPKGTLIAQKGYFYRRADSAVFRGNVQIKDSLKYLEGDSLFSNRRSGYYELYGNIFGNDPANSSKLRGDYLQSDSSGRRVVKGHAWLMNYKNNTAKKDTSKTDSLPAPKPVGYHPETDSLHPFPVDSAHVARNDTSKTAQQPDTTDIFARRIISIAHRTPKDTTTTVKAFSSIATPPHITKPDSVRQAADSLHILPNDSVHTVRNDTSKTALPDTTNVSAHKKLPATHQTQNDTTTISKTFPQKSDSLHISKPDSIRQTADSLHVLPNDSVHTARNDTIKTALPDTTNISAHKKFPATHQIQNDTTTTSKISAQKPDSLHISKPDSVHQTADSLHILPNDSVHTARNDTIKTALPDTTNISAHKTISTAHQTRKDTLATATAKTFKIVRVWSTNFSSLSDSAKYNSKLHTFELWSNAIAWHKNIQLTGPYIKVTLKNGNIKRLISYPNPFVVQKDTSIDRLNQIKGDSLVALFNHGKLTYIQVTGHAHLLHFTKKKGKPDGFIEIQSPLIKIFFKNGKLMRMKSLSPGKKQNTGHYIPKSKQAAKKRLSGFAWNPDKRPQRPQKKLHRRLPPIPKKPPFELPKRYIKHIQQKSQPDSLSTQNKRKLKGTNTDKKSD